MNQNLGGPFSFSSSNQFQAPARSVAAGNNPAVMFGFGFLLIYLVIIFSRVLDVTFYQYKVASITYVLLILSLLASGNALRLVATKTGRWAVLFTLWLCVTIPFGIYRAGSVEAFTTALMSLVVCLAIGALATSVKRVLAVIYTLAAGSLLAALLSIPFAGDRDGRLCLMAGTYLDPNEYAIMLLVGIPGWLLLAKRSLNPAVKVAAFIAVLMLLRTCMLTGSRGAMLAGGAMFLVLFARASALKKTTTVAALLFVVLVSSILLPNYLRLRYLTFFSAASSADAGTQEQLSGADVASTNGRMEMFKQSIEITLQHPLLGVGPGNFANAVFEKIKAETGMNMYLVSHNSYTQVSSETGIPGLILFICVLSSPFRSTRYMRKYLRRDASMTAALDAATYMQTMMITVYVGAFFLSIAYNPIFYALAGLSAALEFVTSAMIRQSSAQPAPVQGGVPGGRPMAGFNPPRTLTPARFPASAK